MTCQRERGFDRLLVFGGALLINLLIVSLISLLFNSAGRRQMAPRTITPPVFLVPAPPESPPESPSPPAPAEPETPSPPPLEIRPDPMPVPELKPQIELTEIKITPRIETRIKLDAPPRPQTPALSPAPAAVLHPAPGRTFYRVGELDRRPLGLARRQPPYPFRARRRGIEGRVRIRFYITPAGRVEDLRIVKAEPAGYFEKTVRQTVAGWRFKPGMVGGRAVRTLVETTIVFKLDR